MNDKLGLDVRMLHDIYDTLMPPNFPACTRAMLEEVIKCAIDITHENGTYDGTKDAVIMTIKSTLTDIRLMIDYYNENN